MKVTPEGIALIKKYEGCELTAYLCPAGRWTIGYGHTGANVQNGYVITADDAEKLLIADIEQFDSLIAIECPKSTASQHSAMLCLAYNIGLQNFRKSSVLRLHNAKDYVGAAHAFALWNKATDSTGRLSELRGLTHRRAAEAALYLSDDGQIDQQRTRASDVQVEKPLSASRVMIGSAVGGGATIASGATQTIAEIEHAKNLLLPLTPYLPLLQKLFILLGLLGIGVAMFARWQDRQKGKL